MTLYELFGKLRSGEITRREFCDCVAELQGFDGAVRMTADNSGFKYRDHVAIINNGRLVWLRDYNNTELCEAKTMREFKIKVDINEIHKGIRRQK